MISIPPKGTNLTTLLFICARHVPNRHGVLARDDFDPPRSRVAHALRHGRVGFEHADRKPLEGDERNGEIILFARALEAAHESQHPGPLFWLAVGNMNDGLYFFFAAVSFGCWAPTEAIQTAPSAVIAELAMKRRLWIFALAAMVLSFSFAPLTRESQAPSATAFPAAWAESPARLGALLRVPGAETRSAAPPAIRTAAAVSRVPGAAPYRVSITSRACRRSPASPADRYLLLLR